MRYSFKRMVEFSDYPDWTSISRRFAPLFTKAATLQPGSAIKQEAAKIAARHPGALERASAALELVQREVRYIYVGLDGGNLKPASADETWQRRYGDCKGKTALLLALLTELGIDAEPIMVSNKGVDDELDQRLPNPGMFDHVLVRAQLGDAVYFLDGTLPSVAVPSRRPAWPYRWVLPLTAAGTSIQPVVWTPPKQPDSIQLYEIDARAGFDQPVRLVTTTIIRGIKGLEQQVQLSAATPAQMLSAFQQNMGDPWTNIDDVSWRFDVNAQASILTISGSGTIDWDDEGGGAKALSLPGGGFSPPEKMVRSGSNDQGVPFANTTEFSCHVTTVRLPSSIDSSRWWVNTSFDTKLFGRNYYRTFGFKDGSVRMIRGFRVVDREIDVAAATRDNGRIAAFDNSKARIDYDPSGRGNLGAVGFAPATYDFDWTGSEVPCLSKAALAGTSD